MEKIGPDFFGAEEFDGVGDPDAWKVRVTIQAAARFAIGHRLRAGGTFGASRTQMQDGFAPVANALLDENGDGIDLEALSAPAEDAVGRRVAASDDVDPEGLFGGRFEEVDFDVQTVLLGELVDAGQCAFNGFGDGWYLDAGIRAEEGDRLLAVLGWNASDSLHDQRGNHRTVLAATKAYQPRACVLLVKLAQGALDVVVNGTRH